MATAIIQLCARVHNSAQQYLIFEAKIISFQIGTFVVGCVGLANMCFTIFSHMSVHKSYWIHICVYVRNYETRGREEVVVES